MAGRRHHYLPRFLQRPFAFRQKSKHFYVHAHHRAHGAYGTNVMELGQELDFYGGPEDPSLDDAITAGEKQLAITVNRLNSGEPVEPAAIASLICAMGIRTKSMRTALTSMIPLLLEAGRSRLLDGKQLQNELDKSLHDPKKRRELIYEQIRKEYGHLSREQQGKFYARMLPQWKTLVQQNESRLLAEAEALVDRALDYMQSEATSIANNAFLGALSKGPDTPIRAQRMVDEMTFEIWDAPDGHRFILGDCGPLAMFTDGKPRLALGAIDDEVEMASVYLPISPTRCIVGSLPSPTQPLEVDDLNRISAALSHEFFVSDQADGPALAALREVIGSLVPIATEEEMFQLLAEDDPGL